MAEQHLKPGTWRIDTAHSVIGFSVRHMMVSRVRGRFESFDAVLTVPENPMESSVRATIDAASLNTDNADRDNHVRSADFFDVANHPQWTFTSTGIGTQGEDFLLRGDLTVKGTTRPVELRLEYNGVTLDTYGLTRAGFHAETEISRREFGVDIEMPMDGGGVVVADRIKIDIDAEFTHQGE
ncbi:YceI family protein [Streptomonospora nanhaiensis]|uniref:Polyisoprenoid-binding protein YceI n=1 Tax=Streptomonospora nanhaiensis TaxID=1323731 RepID=A0A853BJT2_9ACTN|nr:YceI family protein [Streptomonospora nanhaiensis]MBV2362473.1 YceI family protein [Streptomonospora nanhaiensis]MBX9389066.1 YceI family protein [Streptomonospora nanhaiensis]NYI94867.1 polyisoprenoid-binding protein YceI [Streptomonospora nanhaiensis]